ncbi:MAG: RNA 2',3'-cyclic phosphodiesterase [Proteobacteria bacterium]|nr:RNA 2',3'-cyclic phosphodiesterase [Desulfobacula sp.]MBU3951672.1 RNA 2',3'-cyclic phosphodiesterase [Pseudomonadota bacterium]MBU4132836.1 RNA 2',3'-cyclic phosphodiesterase [Pseudomonadota bacterium]
MKLSDSPNTLRTFIAIPMAKNISLFLNRLQGEIGNKLVKASWARTASMHLTLIFLGDTSKKEVQEIIRAMEATVAVCAPFTLSAGGVGVFPGLKKARVIWAGVRGQVDELERVQRLLEKNIEQAGIKADNKLFSPHFTLGRFKDRVDSRLLEAVIQNFGHCASEPWPVKSMVLFKSDLRPSGAVHTPLFEAEFTGY